MGTCDNCGSDQDTATVPVGVDEHITLCKVCRRPDAYYPLVVRAARKARAT